MSMKIDKQFFIKNILSICCVLTLIFLALPMFSVGVTSEFMSASAGSMMGYTVALGSFGLGIIGWLMVLCPLLLLGINYIKQIEKYKAVLSVILPLVCVIVTILMLFINKGTFGQIDNDVAKSEIKTLPGFYLTIISYVLTAVAGAFSFYGLKLNNLSISNLKEAGSKIVKDVTNVDMGDIKNISLSKGSKAAEIAESKEFSNATSDSDADNSDNATGGVSFGFAQKKRTNLSKADEIIALIERLAKMKKDGILSEEEFTEKKKQLLEEI